MNNISNNRREEDIISSTDNNKTQGRRFRMPRTQGNYILAKGEVNNKPSITVPDQTMSLKQILERHTRGQEIPVLQPFYSHTEEWEEYLPDITKMDRFERMELAERIRNNAHEAELAMLDRAKQKAEAKKAEAKTNIDNLKKEFDENKTPSESVTKTQTSNKE